MLVAPLILAGLGACESAPGPPPVDTHIEEFAQFPTPPLDSLRAAPESIQMGSAWIVADADLYLNMMPGDDSGLEEQEGPPMSPLHGTFHVRTTDSLAAGALITGVALRGAWLRAGDSTWALSSAQLVPGLQGVPPLAHSVGGGPLWLGEDDTVDVVVRVRYPDGSSRLVQKRRVHVYGVQ